jgi:hypothetical protein
MPLPSHSPRLDYCNYTWWRVQIMKLFVMQFSPPSCHLIPLRSLASQIMPHSLPFTFDLIHYPQSLPILYSYSSSTIEHDTVMNSIYDDLYWRHLKYWPFPPKNFVWCEWVSGWVTAWLNEDQYVEGEECGKRSLRAEDMVCMIVQNVTGEL